MVNFFFFFGGGVGGKKGVQVGVLVFFHNGIFMSS